MENNKKLTEGLLKADGIDLKGVSETERKVFRKMLDSEQNRKKRLSWLSIGVMWAFVLAIITLNYSENLLEKLHIPLAVPVIALATTMVIVMIRYMPAHNRKLEETNKKISKLHYLVYGNHRGFALVSRNGNKRIIHWPSLLILTVVLWLGMSLAGAGVYYIMCQRWIYASPSGAMWVHIFLTLCTPLGFLTGILRSGLKAPLEELAEVKVKPKPSKPGIARPDIWRIIMKSKITKFAAAAVIIIGVLVGINQLGDSIDGVSVALGQIIESMQKMPWVHWKVTSEMNNESIETWVSFTSSIVAQKRENGIILYNNLIGGIEHTYDPQENLIYVSQVEEGIREKQSIPEAPFQLVEIVMDHLNENGSQIVAKTVFEGGREIKQITAEMAANSKANQIQLKIDRLSNLLLSMKVVYKDSSKDIYVEYEYPEQGPQSIYELGAPQDVKVVSLIMPSDIPEMIKKLNTLREKTLTSYVAISIPSDIDQIASSFSESRPPRYFTVHDNLVSAMWRKKGERCHSMGYFPKGLDTELIMERLSEDPQEFAESLIAVKTDIYKASKRRIYHYQLLNGKPIQNVRKGPVETYGSEIFIEQICWPKIVIPQNTPVHWKSESVTGSNNEPLIMIERKLDSGNIARWFLNPVKNYICQKNELLNPGLTKSVEVLEYARTPSGQWYPRKIRKNVSMINDTGEKVEFNVSRLVSIDEIPVFPSAIFNPRSLPKSSK